jgi:N-acetyl-anhydromuramyl-L-alanine amidase AmpD
MPQDPDAATLVPAAKGNYAQGRAGADVDMIVVHTEQGSETGTEAWFSDPNAHASAHFSISKAGALVQEVGLDNTAFHSGNARMNRHSVGIELEGYEATPEYPGDFTGPMLGQLAWTIAWLCRRYGIPPDRTHIIGHAEVPDPNDPTLFGGANHHTDPGVRFPWDSLMASLGQLLNPQASNPEGGVSV